MKFAPVPERGPLTINQVYRRKDIHARFSGNQQAGIVPSTRENVILLFHTKEKDRQFYEDRVDPDGVYWYSGEGTLGDMKWTAANRAIRDHDANGRDLLFFERFERQDGLWQFQGERHCICHKEETRPDKSGAPRLGILFGLISVGEESALKPGQSSELVSLRAAASASASDSPSTAQRVANYFARSKAVRDYALARAAGVCEGCNCPAPFETAYGPFLEVHHLDRLADSGPDRPERVAAVCPNCHRRCHYANDFREFNETVRRAVVTKETSIAR